MFKDIIYQLHVALNQHKHIFAMCHLTARMAKILSLVGNFCWGVKVPVIAKYTGRWRKCKAGTCTDVSDEDIVRLQMYQLNHVSSLRTS